jgi:hypothetical protein
MRVGYGWENQKERDHYENQDVGGWIILRWSLERLNAVVWTGLMWLRTESGGMIL